MLKYEFKNVSNGKEIAKNRNLILRKIEDLSKIQCRIMEWYPQRIKRNLQQRTQLEQKSETIHFKNANSPRIIFLVRLKTRLPTHRDGNPSTFLSITFHPRVNTLRYHETRGRESLAEVASRSRRISRNFVIRKAAGVQRPLNGAHKFFPWKLAALIASLQFYGRPVEDSCHGGGEERSGGCGCWKRREERRRGEGGYR